MTPFVQLGPIRKSANAATLLRHGKNFGRGLTGAPGDLVAAVTALLSGKGMVGATDAMSLRHAGIRPPAEGIGNLLGHGLLAGGALAGSANAGQTLADKLKKQAARGDQLVKLLGKLYHNSPTGAASGPAGNVLGFFGNRGGASGGRRVIMEGGPLENILRNPDKLDRAYFGTVFGDTKNMRSTIADGMSAFAPGGYEGFRNTAQTALLDNVANRQPLRDLMARKVRDFRAVSRQGQKKPQLTSDTIHIP